MTSRSLQVPVLLPAGSKWTVTWIVSVGPQFRVAVAVQ